MKQKSLLVSVFDDLQKNMLKEAEERAPRLVEEIARESIKSLLKLGDRVVNAPKKKRKG